MWHHTCIRILTALHQSVIAIIVTVLITLNVFTEDESYMSMPDRGIASP